MQSEEFGKREQIALGLKRIESLTRGGVTSSRLDERSSVFLPEKDPRPPGWGTLANESAGALWFRAPGVSGASPFPRSRITAVKSADLSLPEKNLPTPGWGTLAFESAGALWFEGLASLLSG